MKKVLGLIFAALLALAGCGQTNTATTESSSTASSVDSSSQSSQVKEEKTKILKGKMDEFDVTMTFVYTDVVKNFKMDMLGKINEEIPAGVTPEEFEDVEVEIHQGQQPVYPYLFSVE